ncbi:MAG: hypothetical protein ABWY27_12365, partial [Telluria sp.]
AIKGLSMSATAEILEKDDDVAAAKACLLKRFPQVAEWGEQAMAENMAFLRITPQLVCVLDYTKGFGHTELLNAAQAAST